MRYKGDLAEEKALSFLQDLGFVIVDRNFYTKYGEIDIIAKKDDFKDNECSTVLHFIEVKSGQNFDPLQNLHRTKLERIIRSIQVYEQQFKLDIPFVVDAVIVRPAGIEFLENITL